MMTRKLLFNIISVNVFLFFVLFQACDDTITGDDIDNRIIPEENVSFRDHILPVLTLKCNNSGCHEPQALAGGLDFTSWDGVRADFSVVSPFLPETSKIVWSVEGRSGASPMPPINSTSRPFTKEQVRGLRTWIEEGAENN